VIENYSKSEVRAVVRLLQAEGVSESKIHRRLVSVYGQNLFNRKEPSVWCNKFKDGRTTLGSTVIIHRNRGRPRTSHTDENCVIVEGLIREDQRVKVREIAAMTGIAKSTGHEINLDLNFCKVSARWIPKMLTEEHKSQRRAASLENICCYQNEEELFVECIVMGDETWVYEFTPESKRNFISNHSYTILQIPWKGTIP
jgi:histone-lysine N-methyltransferase SETMAR